MRKYLPIFSGIVGILVAVGFGYAIWPIPTKFEIKRPVWETRTKTTKALVPEVIDGTLTWKETMRPVEYRVVRFVSEEVTIPVSWSEKFTRTVIVAASLLYGAYVTFVLFYWMFCTSHGTDTYVRHNIELRLHEVLFFMLGIIGAVVGVNLQSASDKSLSLLQQELRWLQDSMQYSESPVSPASTPEYYGNPIPIPAYEERPDEAEKVE